MHNGSAPRARAKYSFCMQAESLGDHALTPNGTAEARRPSKLPSSPRRPPETGYVQPCSGGAPLTSGPRQPHRL